MKHTPRFLTFGFIACFTLVFAGCQRSRYVNGYTTTQVASGNSSGSNGNTTGTNLTTPNPCDPTGFSGAASTVGAVTAGQPATIQFTVSGNCGYAFRINGYTLNASNQISMTFNTAGSATQQFEMQLLTTSGTPVSGVGTKTITLVVTVVAPPQPPPAAPACQLVRVTPPLTTENAHAARIQLIAAPGSGPITSSAIGGNAVAVGGTFDIQPVNAVWHYDVLGSVTGPGGAGTCQLTFDVPFCTQAVSSVHSGEVTTVLSFAGPVNAIYIQGVSRPVPGAAPWQASYTENFNGKYGPNWNRATAGRVTGANGDSWNCPVSYDVPGVPRPEPGLGGAQVLPFNSNYDYNLVGLNGNFIATGFGATGALGIWGFFTRPTVNYQAITGNWFVSNPVGDFLCEQPQDNGAIFSVVIGHAAAGHGTICARLQPWLQIINGQMIPMNWDFNSWAQCPGNKVMYGLHYLSKGQGWCGYNNGCRELYCGDIYVRPGI